MILSLPERREKIVINTQLPPSHEHSVGLYNQNGTIIDFHSTFLT